ncbi:MAG: signal transduction histidine kinase [Parasphingorhabdus sp.]|jgi:signal transduction histidine kinase
MKPGVWLARFRASLSAKILSLFLVAAVMVIMVIASLFSGVWKHHFRDAISPHLAQYINYIKQDLGNPPSPQAAAELARNLPLDIVILGPGLEWSSTGELLDYDDLEFYGYDRRHGLAVQYGEYNYDQFFVKTSIDNFDVLFLVDEVEASGNQSGRLAFLLVPILLVLLMIYFLLRWLLRPIKTLESGVASLAEGDLDFRVMVKRTDELGLLANQFNQMATEIQAMLESKRQLLLSISHELRSPLTRANVTLALLSETAVRNSLKQDVNEMEQLIAQLLEAERLSTHHSVLNTESVAVAELIDEVLVDYFEVQVIKLSIDSDLPLVDLDPARIKILIKNLLENAIRFNPEGADPVTLTVRRVGAELRLTVADKGPGIDEEKIAQMTEPFWRGDESRQRGTGSYGLGLHLCLRIAEAHGGSLKIKSVLGNGTQIEVALPLETSNDS